jgi:uncharacterized protein YfkK (UPF0435 family)
MKPIERPQSEVANEIEKLTNKINWGLFTNERYAREAQERLNYLNDQPDNREKNNDH